MGGRRRRDREPGREAGQYDLLKIVENRYNAGSLIITSQVLTDRWYKIIGNPEALAPLIAS